MLNDAQKQAVECTEGPLLVLAGAGAGKTHTLTERVSYLIEKMGVDPSSILCVTFTNKAAREMRERIAKRLGTEPSTSIYRNRNFPLVGTFHALGIYFLRQYMDEMPDTKLDRNFVIFDEDDKIKLIRAIMQQLNIEDEKEGLNAKGIVGAISAAKNAGITSSAYGFGAMGANGKTIAEVFIRYAAKMEENRALDFDDILLKWLELLKNEAIREKIHTRFQYFLIDEYQDTNQVQYQIVKFLASKTKNVCVVGDDWQGIYSWRGANIANIHSFQKDYPTATVIKLEQNYRSTQNIINAANTLIKTNPQTFEKTMFTNNEEGIKIKVLQNSDDKQEALTVAQLIKDGDAEYSSWAVLYRTNSQSRVFEEAFLMKNIPYKIYGGLRFYERKEIKDLLAYLRLLSNPFDTASAGRILNIPKRNLGPKALSWLLESMSERSFSFLEVLKNLEMLDDIPPSSRNGFFALQSLWIDLVAQKDRASVFGILSYIISKVNYKEYLENGYDGDELEDKKANVEEFLNLASKFEGMAPQEGLNAFLEEIALMSDLDKESENGSVAMMSVHMAKGLEFENVAVVGLEEGIFPHSRTFGKTHELEEERRCMYVAMTRAKKQLFLSHALSRFTFGQYRSNPSSRFLKEVPQELCETEKFGREVFSSSNSYNASYSSPFGSAGGSGFSFGSSSSSSGSFRPKSVEQNTPPREAISIGFGDMVSHAHFGYGRVVSMDGDIATIAFDAGKGIKKLNIKIAPLQKRG